MRARSEPPGTEGRIVLDSVIGLFEIMVASRRGESRRTLSALSCLPTWDDIVF